MEEQDKVSKETNNDISSQAEVSSSTVILEGFLRIFGLTLLLITITIILISTVFLLKSSFANHIASGKINLDIFNIDFDIQKFNYLYFKIIGCLLLLNVVFLPVISKRKLKLFRYIGLIISSICLLCSLQKLLILTDFNSNRFLVEVMLILTCLTSVFSDIFVKREKLYDTNNLITLMILILSAIIYYL
jgi:hypothetical protein